MTIFSEPVELTARAEEEAEAEAAEEVSRDEFATEAIEVAELELGTSPFAISMRQ